MTGNFSWAVVGRGLVVAGLIVVGQVGRAASVDVYILTGQSNSLGTTALDGVGYLPGSVLSDSLTRFYWSNVSASNSSYPPVLYGSSAGAITTLQVQQGDNNDNPYFWGPEFGLARTLAPRSPHPIMIIKASRGGGGNSLWDQATYNVSASAGHMWQHLLNTVDDALTDLTTGGDTFAVRGLVYMQGESNGTTEANLAGQRLSDLIDGVRGHINATFANAATDMHTTVIEIAASGSTTNRSITNQAQLDLATQRADVSYVDTSDLPLKSDGIHFGRDAMLTIGTRVADAFASALDLPNGIPGDVTQDGLLSGTGSLPPMSDDVAAFRQGWLHNTANLSPRQMVMHGDLNLSGRTDLADAFLLHAALRNAGIDVAIESLAVPEAATSRLLSLFVAVALWRRLSHGIGPPVGA